MKKYCQYILALALFVATVQVGAAQVCGCTDSLAVNFNPMATVNDGSCVYGSTIITADGVGILDAQLGNTSSFFYWENGYWTNNDCNDSCLYQIDSTNAETVGTLCFEGIQFYDMEEITQDSLYLYFGDVGNNSGSRQNLHIWRIRKESILNQNVEIDTIWFSYEDQTDFTYSPQATDFDCEAFVVADDSIYIFTKEWISTKTTLYSIPKTPGTHIAHRRETYDVNGLITGATYIPEYQLVVLCGYDYDPANLLSSLHPFVVLLYDFQGERFFSGNKRRLDFDFSTRAQIEAIATRNALDYYITNENTPVPVMDDYIDIPPVLQHLDLHEYILPYLSRFGVADNPDAVPSLQNQMVDIRIYPNPVHDRIHIDFPQNFAGAVYEIYNLRGQKVAEGALDEHVIILDHRNMPAGQYVLTVRGKGSLKTMSFVKNE